MDLFPGQKPGQSCVQLKTRVSRLQKRKRGQKFLAGPDDTDHRILQQSCEELALMFIDGEFRERTFRWLLDRPHLFGFS
jgi:hypothetical protein